MYETISTENMTHEDWLYLRKSGIGGSDAGAVNPDRKSTRLNSSH